MALILRLLKNEILIKADKVQELKKQLGFPSHTDRNQHDAPEQAPKSLNERVREKERKETKPRGETTGLSLCNQPQG